jgi:hypothetical protein
MRASSLLGLSAGWLLTSIAVAVDVGPDDLIFFPSLALGVPAVVGLVVGARAFRQAPPEPIHAMKMTAFVILGVFLMTMATMALLAAFYWGTPIPPAD